jgi:hypothetical protein
LEKNLKNQPQRRRNVGVEVNVEGIVPAAEGVMVIPFMII